MNSHLATLLLTVGGGIAASILARKLEKANGLIPVLASGAIISAGLYLVFRERQRKQLGCCGDNKPLAKMLLLPSYRS